MDETKVTIGWRIVVTLVFLRAGTRVDRSCPQCYMSEWDRCTFFCSPIRSSFRLRLHQGGGFARQGYDGRRSPLLTTFDLSLVDLTDLSKYPPPCQLLTIGQVPTVVTTINEESGFESGNGACETATTSRESCWCANHPLPATEDWDVNEFFHSSICAKWNAKNFVQDLISGHRFHFQRW